MAESCTGGLVGAALTEISGSSDVFEASFVTYGNDAKIRMLGVSSDVLETFGAVSIATAWAMAQGAMTKADVDVAVAITGIAGPDGGSEKKPIGTVIFARAEKNARTRQDQGRTARVRRPGPRRRAASGGAVRARTADARERARAAP